MNDGLRVARLAVVMGFAASLWACYSTATAPGDQAARLRALTTAPRVTLIGTSDSVEVRPDSELKLHTRSGESYAAVPAGMSFSGTAMKLGPAADPDAPVIAYDDVRRIDVTRFSVGRTLALVLPLAGGVLVASLYGLALTCLFNGC